MNNYIGGLGYFYLCPQLNLMKRMVVFFPYNKLKMAAGIYLFSKDGKVLLQKRGSKTNTPNVWGCFGGKSEDNETAFDAAKREFAEESGFKGDIENLELVHINVNTDGFVFYSFLGYLDEEIETPMVGQKTVDGEIESDDAKYFSLNEVFNLDLHQGTKKTFLDKMELINNYLIKYCAKNF